jgi:hypothetical protein
MQDIIDATDIRRPCAAGIPEATTESPSEQMLGEAITNLWVAHANAKIAARATNEELRTIRAKSLGGFRKSLKEQRDALQLRLVRVKRHSSRSALWEAKEEGDRASTSLA